MDVCVLCGKPAECRHHLIFGTGKRKLCEEDKDAGVVIPMCNECHNMAIKATERIHGNSVAEKLSKMLGQALWERWYLCDYGDAKTQGQEARDEFMARYGRSYL